MKVATVLVIVSLFSAVFKNCNGWRFCCCSSTPPSILHGSSGTPTSRQAGGTVTYSCHHGYQLSGSATATCSGYPQYIWRPIPSCTVVSCGSPPSILYGYRGAPTNTMYGGTVTYSCYTGYELSRSATVTCEVSGNWSTRPNCTAVSCGPPPSISNGSPGTQINTTFGGTVTYSCSTGHQPSGTATVTCEATGNWSSPPRCTAVSCGFPPSISNGSSGPPTHTTFRDTVTYSCNPGYDLSGSANVTCEASGNWSTLPSCRAVSCGSPPLILNGSPEAPTHTTYRGTVLYICNTGYELLGEATVTCLASGSWSTRPNCTAISCGPPPSISYGYYGTPTHTMYRQTVNYSCNTGYQLSGSATVTCEASGNWSTRPNCSAISCGPPPMISNGSSGTPTSMMFEGSVTYSCENGYELSGSAMVTCEASGNWSTLPSCRAVSCGSPPLILNGSPEALTHTTYRGTVLYICNPGYELLGEATVTCLGSGSWSTRPNCTAISCGPPPMISNGSSNTLTSMMFGGTVTYSCENGYDLEGSANVTCQASGSWSTRPTCTAVSCGSPLSIPNGSPGTPTSTTYRGSVTYSCDSGYQLSGSATVTCQASGSWSTRPICKAICPGITLINGDITYIPRSSPLTEGVLANLSCNFGYQLAGDWEQRCENNGTNGVWSGQSFCQATPEAIRVEIVPKAAPPMFANSYSLSCTVYETESFEPSFDYIWLKDSQSIQHFSSSSLFFDALKLSDVGEYQCLAMISSPLWNESITVYSGSYELSFTTLPIQLRLNGIHSCHQYTSVNTPQKTADIVRGLVDGVSRVCGCMVNSSFITNAFLKCFKDSQDHVTFRATLSGTVQLSIPELLLITKKWTNSMPSLIVQNFHLSLNNTCEIVINNFDSAECFVSDSVFTTESANETVTEKSTQNSSFATIAGVVIAVVLIIVGLSIVVLVIAVVVRRRRKKVTPKKGNEDSHRMEVIPTIYTKPPGSSSKVVGLQSSAAADHEYEDPEKLFSKPVYAEVGPPLVNKKACMNLYSIESCDVHKIPK